MSDEERGASIKDLCSALSDGDLDRILSIYTEAAILMLILLLSEGKKIAFSFKGKEEIKQWAFEFKQHFPALSFIENRIIVQEDNVIHEFIIEATVQDGRMGRLPCVGTYEFKDGSLENVMIIIYQGSIFVKRSDLL